jgi:hypothetical protein
MSIDRDIFSTISIPDDDDGQRLAFSTLQTWGKRLRNLISVGTWQPVDTSGANLSFTFNYPPLYCKVGPLVWISLDVTYPTTADTTAALIGNLPYRNVNAPTGLALAYTTYTTATLYQVNPNDTAISPYKLAGGQPTNANLSTLTIRASGVYQTAE